MESWLEGGLDDRAGELMFGEKGRTDRFGFLAPLQVRADGRIDDCRRLDRGGRLSQPSLFERDGRDFVC